jgi:hypothetical protein
MSELSVSLSKAGLSPPLVGERENLYASLGPGLITGAADDDPSGIATCSQVGAQFGFAMLWTMLFSFPLTAAIQEICARLGRITGMGVAANLAKCYAKTVVRGLACASQIFSILAPMLRLWRRRFSCWSAVSCFSTRSSSEVFPSCCRFTSRTASMSAISSG